MNGAEATRPRVLISDELSQRAVEIFQERGIDVDVKVGLKPDELKKIIGQYDGLAIRSNTKVTKDVLEHAEKLKIVGRAGIGGWFRRGAAKGFGRELVRKNPRWQPYRRKHLDDEQVHWLCISPWTEEPFSLRIATFR